MMFTSLSHSPGISRLPPELLWQIFELNTEIEYHNCLRILRYTSQVCSEWRKIALESPSLWGRVFNDCFLERSNEWRAEIIKRTGNSALYVKADKETLIKMGSSVESVLDENWARIRKLKLEFSRWHTPSEKYLSIFQRPAPISESFHVDIHHTTPTSFTSGLFNNDARCLRIFSMTNTTLDFTKASWASNLCELELWSHVSIVDALQSLLITSFPVLDRLLLSDNRDRTPYEPTINNSLHPVSLPRLKLINIDANQEIEAVLFLLSMINPAIDCTLDFYASSASPEAFVFNNIPNVLPKYLAYATQLSSVTMTYFVFRGDMLKLTLSEKGRAPIFRFGLNCDTNLPEHVMSTLLSYLTTFQLHHISKLDFFITPTDSDLVNDAIGEFIFNATSIVELFTDTKSLAWLQKMEGKRGAVAFPFLKNTRNYDRT